MTEDLLSLRAAVISREARLRDLFRKAAPLAAVPAEIVDCDDMDVALSAAGSSDICYLDGALSRDKLRRVVAAMRAAAKPPFMALLTAETAGPPCDVDGLADKPSRLEEAKRLLDRSLRLRLVSRVLVVDDSATIRSIVRKALSATRFAFEVGEAVDGADALRLIREDHYDVIFVDQNMPDTSGLECLARIKQLRPDIAAIVMTSMQNAALADEARTLGAAFLRKPFFPPDIENALCGFYGLRALYSKRS